MLKKARRIEKKGYYSQSDIYLLNWFLVGDCACFWQKPTRYEGEPMFRDVYDCVTDPNKLNLMVDNPVHAYCCRKLDEVQAANEARNTGVPFGDIACLMLSVPIRHVAMLMVSTTAVSYTHLTLPTNREV